MKIKSASLPLKTKRLIIRPIDESDYREWKLAFSSQLFPQNQYDQGNLSAENLKLQSFKKRIKRESLSKKNETAEVLHFFERKTGKIIGRCGFEIQRGKLQSVHLGYSIFNLYWGNGFGKEAVKSVLYYIFKNLKIHRIEITIEPDNKRSIRLARSLGFKKEGIKRKFLLRDNEWRDVILFSLICDDYGIAWKH